MRIPAYQYADVGKSLPIGQQTRIDHVECPAGQDTRQRLYVKRLPHMVVAYCHNCGHHGVRGINTSDVRAIAELLEAQQPPTNEKGELVLPDDVLRNPDLWPIEAQAWVYKYSITSAEIVNNELCYSASWNRVILPVFANGKLVFWQGRAIGKDQDPKYINVRAHPKVMAWHHAPIASNRNKIFIVEDRLSGIKLGRYVDTVALLGTSPDFDCLTDGLQNYKRVGVWLDPDTAGIRKGTELTNRLSLVFGGKVAHFSSSYHQQPKEMDDVTLAAISSGL